LRAEDRLLERQVDRRIEILAAHRARPPAGPPRARAAEAHVLSEDVPEDLSSRRRRGPLIARRSRRLGAPATEPSAPSAELIVPGALFASRTWYAWLIAEAPPPACPPVHVGVVLAGELR
jgi:hypothetical protein